MKISCIGCGRREFDINPAEVELAKIVTFVCPECGEYTAVSQRKGGGIIVAVDEHGKGKPPTGKESHSKPAN